MPSLYDTARDALAKELERFRNRPFLEATMAASALMARADGAVNLSELNTLDQALDAIHELNIYDPHEAVDLYRDYVDALDSGDPETRENIMKAVARIAGDEHEARLLLKVCVAIAKSDETLNDAERTAFAALCEALEIDPATVEI